MKTFYININGDRYSIMLDTSLFFVVIKQENVDESPKILLKGNYFTKTEMLEEVGSIIQYLYRIHEHNTIASIEKIIRGENGRR